MGAQKNTVLFVDDEPHVLTAIRRAVIDEPFDSLFAGSAKEALQLMEQKSKSVIVTDMRMPVMSGLEALQALSLPPLPFISAQVVDVEGPVGLAIRLELALEVDEALSAGVDGEAPKVAHDPAAAQPLSNSTGGAGAAEDIRHEVALIGGGTDDALQEGFGLLGSVFCIFYCLRIYWNYICP